MKDICISPKALLIAKRRYLRKANARFTSEFQQIPPEDWPMTVKNMTRAPFQVFRNRDFLVQVFGPMVMDGAERPGMPESFTPIRLSIVRTALNDSGQYREDISWEDLMACKRGCGYGDQDAVEVMPADGRIVNVANMRHLWIMGTMPWIWKAGL